MRAGIEKVYGGEKREFFSGVRKIIWKATNSKRFRVYGGTRYAVGEIGPDGKYLWSCLTEAPQRKARSATTLCSRMVRIDGRQELDCSSVYEVSHLNSTPSIDEMGTVVKLWYQHEHACAHVFHLGCACGN